MNEVNLIYELVKNFEYHFSALEMGMIQQENNEDVVDHLKWSRFLLLRANEPLFPFIEKYSLMMGQFVPEWKEYLQDMPKMHPSLRRQS